MNDATLRGKAAIIGIGQSPVGKVPGRSPLWLAADAARKAIADAGLKKSAIDGVLSSHAFASPFHRFSVAFSEYFGLQPTFSNTLQVSGATAATMFSIGAAAIQAGLAENVLIVAADSLMTGLSPDLALRSLTESRDQQYEMPFGIPVANTFAMTAHRHMKEFGTTAEQLATVAVIHRRHASRTLGAQQTKPITIEDVITSGKVTTPYHKLDCSLISDGGAAFVLTSAAQAKALGIAKPIYILGAGKCYTHEHIFLMPSLTTTGAVEFEPQSLCDGGVWAVRSAYRGCLRLFHWHGDHDPRGPWVLSERGRRGLRGERRDHIRRPYSDQHPRRAPLVRASRNPGFAVSLP